MKKILLLLLPLLGLAGGVGAALVLRPEPDVLSSPCGEVPSADSEAAPAEEPLALVEEADLEFIKLANQFVVPVVDEGAVSAMVVMSLSLEVLSEARDRIFKLEPKLRDAFLQVMFEHANIGGFSGTFTTGENMDLLRRALSEAAGAIAGPSVRNVLIVDIVRQDI